METRRLILFALVAVGAIFALVFALHQSEAPDAVSARSTPAPAFGDGGARATAKASVAPQSAPVASPAEEKTPIWETQIDQVLRSNVNEVQTAQILLNLLPTLPEDGQVEAANHIANLLPDENYAQAKPVLLNPNLPESVLSVLFGDLMNRGDPIKLRTFLDIARIPNHPFHEEAQNDLEIYLGDDYGTDWPKWNAALEKFLKEEEAQ